MYISPPRNGAVICRQQQIRVFVPMDVCTTTPALSTDAIPFFREAWELSLQWPTVALFGVHVNGQATLFSKDTCCVASGLAGAAAPDMNGHKSLHQVITASYHKPSPWFTSEWTLNWCKQGGRVAEPVYIPGRAKFPGSTHGLPRSHKTPENASPSVTMLCKTTSDTSCRHWLPSRRP